MSREITTTVYQFDELSDKAKEKAREWWRDCEQQEFGGFGEASELAETPAKILGIEFSTHSVPLHGGKTREEPKIWWSGFSSQGDGASFEGHYAYAKNCAKAIRSEFPTDTKLHAIADGLTSMQKEHGYKITAKITQSGRYVHKYTMAADVYVGDVEANEEISSAVLELMRDFAEWIYRALEEEYESRMSDENVDDSIRANEYEFTADGERA